MISEMPTYCGCLPTIVAGMIFPRAFTFRTYQPSDFKSFSSSSGSLVELPFAWLPTVSSCGVNNAINHPPNHHFCRWYGHHSQMGGLCHCSTHMCCDGCSKSWAFMCVISICWLIILSTFLPVWAIHFSKIGWFAILSIIFGEIRNVVQHSWE